MLNSSTGGHLNVNAGLLVKLHMIPVGILGATGTVGQRFIELLDHHPQFYIAAIGASERSAGKQYCHATAWKMTVPIPANISCMLVSTCEPHHFTNCNVIFSGLDASVAGDIETQFVQAEFAVFSNAKNHRMNKFVPLVVPLVNTDHFDMIPTQRASLGITRGFLVTNANCSTTGLVVVLKALTDAFGPLAKIMVTTMQAISGGGYPGVPSLDILGNVVPYISGEEEKIEQEVLKILGSVTPTGFVNLTDTRVSASCNRVAVVDGHTESVFVEFRASDKPSVEEAIHALETYSPQYTTLKLASAPEHAIHVTAMQDRPQPRLDLNVGGGFATVVGRVRKCAVLDVKFTLLCHNTILGAAGSSILNAEVALAKGFIAL